MSGTRTGGKAAAITNKARYGDDFYVNLGRLGGSTSRTGGFYANRELASTAGRKGGLKSRRGLTTHCMNGHELTDDNLYWQLIGGQRRKRCLACRKQVQTARQLRYKRNREQGIDK